MSLARLIDRMVAAGMSAGDAGAVAAEIFALGAASVDQRSSNAIRQQRFRDRQAEKKRNESVTERYSSVTESDQNGVTESVMNRNEALRNNATAVSHIDTSIKNTSRQNSNRASRGTRIDPDWTPSPAEREFASQEGLSANEIDREAARFRDYWKGRAGAAGVKLDWKATWQNWIRTAAEKLGKVPRGPAKGTDGNPMFHAKFGSEELYAWDAYTKQKTGKTLPRDSKGGWHVPARWPPGYTPQAEPSREVQITTRTMQ